MCFLETSNLICSLQHVEKQLLLELRILGHPSFGRMESGLNIPGWEEMKAPPMRYIAYASSGVQLINAYLC